MPLTPAEKQRRYRRRLREGSRCFRGEVEPETIAALVAEGWLSEGEAWNAVTFGQVVSDFLDCWRRGTLRPCRVIEAGPLLPSNALKKRIFSGDV